MSEASRNREALQRLLKFADKLMSDDREDIRAVGCTVGEIARVVSPEGLRDEYKAEYWAERLIQAELPWIRADDAHYSKREGRPINDDEQIDCLECVLEQIKKGRVTTRERAQDLAVLVALGQAWLEKLYPGESGDDGLIENICPGENEQ